MENLQQLLRALVPEKRHSVVNLQLTFVSQGNQLGSWNLKQAIEEQHLD